MYDTENTAPGTAVSETTIDEAEYDITKPVENPTAQDLVEVEAFNADLRYSEYQRRIKAGELTEAVIHIRKLLGLPI